MTRMEMFCQCLMTNGKRSIVGFIPAAAAKVGNTIGLELPHGMDRGWCVRSVGRPIAKDAMRVLEHQHTRQRRASDMGTKTKRVRRARR